jgi:hypothetical protein
MTCPAWRSMQSKLLKRIFLAGCIFLTGLLPAQNLTVIGGTSAEREVASCIEQTSAEDLNRLPGSDHSITIVILERERFLEVKNRFGAYRTKLAFSNLAARRMYLSSDVFSDMDNVLRCIPHELGHFETRSVLENHAEIAAAAIRRRALEVCTMSTEIAPPRALSARVKSVQTPAGTE